jgi:hypothetical protein
MIQVFWAINDVKKSHNDLTLFDTAVTRLRSCAAIALDLQ